MPQEQAEVEKVHGGQVRPRLPVALEILPTIELADFGGIKLERLVAEVTEPRSMRRWRRSPRNQPLHAQGRGREGRERRPRHDQLHRQIAGTPFEGGSGDDVAVMSAPTPSFPGFEDQLLGMAAGEPGR